MKPKKTLAEIKALVEQSKKVKFSPEVAAWWKHGTIGIPQTDTQKPV